VTEGKGREPHVVERAEHRSFVLTREVHECGEPVTAVAAVRNAQFGLGLAWVLLWGMMACGHGPEGKIAMWLPLNYLALDLYLAIRDGRSGKCWRRTSRAMKWLIRLSPVWMLASTFFLGMAGTWLYERVWE
jgi:hypothetical protein